MMVAITVSLFGGNSLYNYITFAVPLNSWTADEEYGSHIDNFWIDRNDAVYPFAIHKITYNESDESVAIIFSGRDSPEHFKIDQKFTHEETLYIDQSFIFHCKEYDDHTLLSVFKYVGTEIVDGETSVSFLHYEGNTKTPMPCIYPDVIIHSIDILFPPTPPS